MDTLLKELAKLEIPKKEKLKYRIDNEGVIIIENVFIGRLDFLNPLAGKIYLMCTGKKSIEKIARCIHKEFPDKDFETILEDIVKIVRRLKARYLLR